eukprot:3653505-Prymnesium_polylepis.1
MGSGFNKERASGRRGSVSQARMDRRPSVAPSVLELANLPGAGLPPARSQASFSSRASGEMEPVARCSSV